MPAACWGNKPSSSSAPPMSSDIRPGAFANPGVDFASSALVQLAQSQHLQVFLQELTPSKSGIQTASLNHSMAYSNRSRKALRKQVSKQAASPVSASLHSQLKRRQTPQQGASLLVWFPWITPPSLARVGGRPVYSATALFVLLCSWLWSFWRKLLLHTEWGGGKTLQAHSLGIVPSQSASV